MIACSQSLSSTVAILYTYISIFTDTYVRTYIVCTYVHVRTYVGILNMLMDVHTYIHICLSVPLDYMCVWSAGLNYQPHLNLPSAFPRYPNSTSMTCWSLCSFCLSELSGVLVCVLRKAIFVLSRDFYVCPPQQCSGCMVFWVVCGGGEILISDAIWKCLSRITLCSRHYVGSET